MKFNKNIVKKILSTIIIINILNFNIITSYAVEERDDYSIQGMIGALFRQIWVSWCTFFDNNNDGTTEPSVMYSFWNTKEIILMYHMVVEL